MVNGCSSDEGVQEQVDAAIDNVAAWSDDQVWDFTAKMFAAGGVGVPGELAGPDDAQRTDSCDCGSSCPCC